MKTPSDLLTRTADLTPDYREPGYLHRLARMFRGFSQPRATREYKEAVIELQRLSAPLSALLLPLLAIALLTLLTSGPDKREPVIVTIYREIDAAPPLKKLEQPDTTPEKTSEVVNAIPSATPDVPSEAPRAEPVPTRHAAINSVCRTPTPVVLRDFYSDTRSSGNRARLLTRFDGDQSTEDAVMRALRWLKKNQLSDGSWTKNKVAMTGLAVLTFLAHGERPGESEEFGPVVQRALEHLLNAQDKVTGRLPGNYDHPIATYALCEAYGMTLNPNVKSAAEKAVALIIKGQHPTGGWTYNLDPAADKGSGQYRDDTSYMGWCAQALKAAKLAHLNVDGLDKAAKLAVKGFKKNASPSGGFGYTSPGAGGLTGVGALCLQLLGAGDEREAKKSMDVMDSWKPSFEAKGPMGGSLQYYFYYATQAKFHSGGKRWESWNNAMKPLYVKAQQIEKDATQDPAGRACDIGWWANGDAHTDRPVMDTCLAALQLMVYYRNNSLATTSVAAVKVEPEIKASATEDGDIPVETPVNL